MPDQVKAVMHLVDTLQVGGAERAAVDYVNHLPRELFRPFLCTTRQRGPLAKLLRSDVTLLHLNRRWTLDPVALLKLAGFIRRHDIRLLHAHGSTLFVARIAQLLSPRTALIWHIHYGRWAVENRHAWSYLPVSLGVDAIVTSSDQLAAWVPKHFFAPVERVAHLPNMVTPFTGSGVAPELPGRPGWRIVSVANLRPEKDHLTLLRAFSMIVTRFPEAHLLLIGGRTNAGVAAQVEDEIAKLDLNRRVSVLGERSDVPAILAQCDIAVLSSVSEGLPVSLLEYGLASLPTVSTSVGQCPVVLDHGAAGFLAPPRCPEQLARGLEFFLESVKMRRHFGDALRQRVRQQYEARPVTEKLCTLYQHVLKALPQTAMQ
jgi:glycosyltransferase involved in cell wall biosynthesis